jgi:hypothetical protein
MMSVHRSYSLPAAWASRSPNTVKAQEPKADVIVGLAREAELQELLARHPELDFRVLPVEQKFWLRYQAMARMSRKPSRTAK